jgi:hypothetical protein
LSVIITTTAAPVFFVREHGVHAGPKDYFVVVVVVAVVVVVVVIFG